MVEEQARGTSILLPIDGQPYAHSTSRRLRGRAALDAIGCKRSRHDSNGVCLQAKSAPGGRDVLDASANQHTRAPAGRAQARCHRRNDGVAIKVERPHEAILLIRRARRTWPWPELNLDVTPGTRAHRGAPAPNRRDAHSGGKRRGAAEHARDSAARVHAHVGPHLNEGVARHRPKRRIHKRHGVAHRAEQLQRALDVHCSDPRKLGHVQNQGVDAPLEETLAPRHGQTRKTRRPLRARDW